jgi:hypothetical protein
MHGRVCDSPARGMYPVASGLAYAIVIGVSCLGVVEQIDNKAYIYSTLSLDDSAIGYNSMGTR